MATEVLDFISSQTGVANIQSDETEEYLSVSGTDLVLSKTTVGIDWVFKRKDSGMIVGFLSGGTTFWLAFDPKTKLPLPPTPDEDKATIFKVLVRRIIRIGVIIIYFVTFLLDDDALTRIDQHPYVCLRKYDEKDPAQIWRIFFSPRK